MNHEIFSDIIGNISDDKIRLFTIQCLKDVDPIFEKMPASVTGKHHPPCSQGEGGLVRHVQRTCYFANVFFDAYKWEGREIKGDIIIASLLLHDIGKKEKYEKSNWWEYKNHPITAAKMLSKHQAMLHEKIFSLIYGCTIHHMGPWSPESTKKEISKYNFLELAVYQCDFLASRKDLDILNPKG